MRKDVLYLWNDDALWVPSTGKCDLTELAIWNRLAAGDLPEQAIVLNNMDFTPELFDACKGIEYDMMYGGVLSDEQLEQIAQVIHTYLDLPTTNGYRFDACNLVADYVLDTYRQQGAE